MNPSAIYSKTGKGVQEASGKTSNLSRADRAVLAAFDGKTVVSEVQKKFEKMAGPKFDALVEQLDKDGFIREVSSGASQSAPTQVRAAPPKTPPPAKAAPPSDGGDEFLDFTQAVKTTPAPAAPKGPSVDLAAAARAESERKAKDQGAFDYKGRQEAEAKAKAEAEAKARAAAEARAKADAEAKARAAAEEQAKARAEADAKVKAARDAAVRMATEAKAKAEADAKVKSDAAAEREREANERARKESEDKARLEAELKGKLEEERKAREDAERRAQEAADRTRKEVEEKAKRDAEELRQRLEAEMKAKLEEERKAREAEDRKRREEEDRRRKEEDERRRKEDEERRAKEEAERKARADEDRKRREEDERRRKEDEERRAKEEAERKARAEADRKKREDEERQRKEEDARRLKEEGERRAKEEAERKARADEDRKRREDEERRHKEESERRHKEESDRRAKEESDRRAREESEAKARAAEEATRAAQAASTPSIPTISTPQPPPPPPAPSAAPGGFDDSFLADLDSFGKKEEEEQKAKEEAERKAREEAALRAKQEEERQAKEAAEKKRRDEEERKRKEEEALREKEEAERQAKEDEKRLKQEEEERKRKAKESLAAKQAEEREKERSAKRAAAGGKSRPAAADDDIGVTDDDLDMDDIKRDERALSKEARAAREQASMPPQPVARPKKWGKPVAMGLFGLLVVGVGLVHVMPVSTTDYEKAASEAMGVPVKIGSARLSLITGVEVKFDAVSIGDGVKIRNVRGTPELGSLFGAKKAFSRIELDGVSFSQSQLADAVLGKVAGENLRVGKIIAKQVKLEGPVTLPPLDVEATVSGDGSLQSLVFKGGDKLVATLTPRGNDIGFEISAGSLALPFLPALTLNDFGMKGTANRGGVNTSDFDGRAYDGLFSGTAKIRWGSTWTVDGELRARGVKIAVFAPALVSEGKVEGRGAYSMSGTNPATLYETARLQGDFKIEQGVLGSFDLTRALQTGGNQSQGRTVFTELTGQAVYDKGAVQIRNVSITAGAMSAGASIDIDANGGLAGRVAAEVKAATQTLRATLNLSGKVQDPVIRK